MRTDSLLQRYACAALASIALAGLTTAATAQDRPADLPPFMAPIAGRTVSTPAETATQNVLALNRGMFELYDDAARIFKQNILSKHPVILGLFSGAGGRFILYRPGQAPLDAPSVPIVYQLLKSVGHSTMALTQVVGPYLDNAAESVLARSAARLSQPDEVGARRPRRRRRCRPTGAIPTAPSWRTTSPSWTTALAKGVISFAALQEFSKKQGPHLKKIIAWAAQTQVAHWMGVIGDWKKMLGADWDKTYAASNTIYVARQNNVLFSVLAQFFGPEAINDRLILIETISFTTTPDDMLHLADPHHRRPLGRLAVLRQLPPDGLRADGRRRPRRHHRRNRKARHEAVPAAGGAVRLEAMADAGHAGAGTHVARRPANERAGADLLGSGAGGRNLASHRFGSAT